MVATGTRWPGERLAGTGPGRWWGWRATAEALLADGLEAAFRRRPGAAVPS